MRTHRRQALCLEQRVVCVAHHHDHRPARLLQEVKGERQTGRRRQRPKHVSRTSQPSPNVPDNSPNSLVGHHHHHHHPYVCPQQPPLVHHPPCVMTHEPPHTSHTSHLPHSSHIQHDDVTWPRSTHRVVQVLQLQELPALFGCIRHTDLLLVYHQQVVLGCHQLDSVLVQHLWWWGCGGAYARLGV